MMYSTNEEQELNNRLLECCTWIVDEGISNLDLLPLESTSLSDALTQKIKFENDFYKPAKVNLKRYRQLLKEVDAFLPNRNIKLQADSLRSLMKTLKRKTKKTMKHLKEVKDFWHYITKAEIWCERASDLWPSFIGNMSFNDINHPNVPLTEIDKFLEKHSPLTNEQLDWLLQFSRNVSDKMTRERVALLANRCRHLKAALETPGTHETYVGRRYPRNNDDFGDVFPLPKDPNTLDLPSFIDQTSPNTTHQQSGYEVMSSTTLSDEVIFGDAISGNVVFDDDINPIDVGQSARLNDIQRKLRDQELLYEQLILENELQEISERELSLKIKSQTQTCQNIFNLESKSSVSQRLFDIEAKSKEITNNEISDHTMHSFEAENIKPSDKNDRKLITPLRKFVSKEGAILDDETSVNEIRKMSTKTGRYTNIDLLEGCNNLKRLCKIDKLSTTKLRNSCNTESENLAHSKDNQETAMTFDRSNKFKKSDQISSDGLFSGDYLMTASQDSHDMSSDQSNFSCDLKKSVTGSGKSLITSRNTLNVNNLCIPHDFKDDQLTLFDKDDTSGKTEKKLCVDKIYPSEVKKVTFDCKQKIHDCMTCSKEKHAVSTLEAIEHWTKVKNDQRLLLTHVIEDERLRKEIEERYFNAQIQLFRVKQLSGWNTTSLSLLQPNSDVHWRKMSLFETVEKIDSPIVDEAVTDEDGLRKNKESVVDKGFCNENKGLKDDDKESVSSIVESKLPQKFADSEPMSGSSFKNKVTLEGKFKSASKLDDHIENNEFMVLHSQSSSCLSLQDELQQNIWSAQTLPEASSGLQQEKLLGKTLENYDKNIKRKSVCIVKDNKENLQPLLLNRESISQINVQQKIALFEKAAICLTDKDSSNVFIHKEKTDEVKCKKSCTKESYLKSRDQNIQEYDHRKKFINNVNENCVENGQNECDIAEDKSLKHSIYHFEDLTNGSEDVSEASKHLKMKFEFDENFTRKAKSELCISQDNIVSDVTGNDVKGQKQIDAKLFEQSLATVKNDQIDSNEEYLNTPPFYSQLSPLTPTDDIVGNETLNVTVNDFIISDEGKTTDNINCDSWKDGDKMTSSHLQNIFNNTTLNCGSNTKTIDQDIGGVDIKMKNNDACDTQENTIISLEIDGSLSFGNFMDNSVDQVTNEDIIKDVKYLKPDNLNVNEESFGRNYCDNHKVTQRLNHVNNDIKLEENSQEYDSSHFDQSVGMKNNDNDITRLDVLDVVVEMDNSGYNQPKNTKNVLEKSSFVDDDVAIDALNNVEILHGAEVVDCFHNLNEELSYNDSQRTIENIFTKTPITDHDIVTPNDFVSTSPSGDNNGDSKIKSFSDKLDTIIAPIKNQVSQLNDYCYDNIEGNYGNLQDSENDEDFGRVLEDIQEEEMEYEDLTGHKNTFFNNNDDDEIMKVAVSNPLSSSFNSIQTDYKNIPYSSSVIIDPGSSSIKAGFSIDEKPRVVIPSIVGYSPKSDFSRQDFCYKNFYVGDEAKHLHHVINMNKPVKNGLVHDWELFEKLLDEVFEELRCEADQYPVLLTEPVLVPKTQREDIVQLLFETYHVPSMYSSSQASLALFATGRTTGVVYDCGSGKCHSVPVYEGYPFPHATFTTEFAGDELTMCLSRMLKDRGINVECNTSISIAEDIKRRLCYVVMDYDNERRAYNFGERKDTSYTLPDGKMIQIGSECFRCPELLFSPSMTGIDIDGVHEMIYKSIFRCSFDMRTSLLENIVIAGGSTMFTGFNRRLHVELSKLAGPQDTVKICAVDERNMLTWQGGSMLSKVPSFHSMWISSSEYDEFGPNIVHRKCV